MKINAQLNTGLHQHTQQERFNIKMAKRLKKRRAARDDVQFRDTLNGIIKHNQESIRSKKV